MFGDKAREIKRLNHLLQTEFSLQYKGDDIIGPVTLESFALMVRYGGYMWDDDILGMGTGIGRGWELHAKPGTDV